jgi:DNA polymerase zeta
VSVAARRQLEDPNNEAQYGDRIPYVIARGAPNDRLVDRAVPPEELFDGLVSPKLINLKALMSFP